MADLPADITTPAVIAPGQSLDDAIEIARDRDWVRIDLVEGQMVQINLDARGPDGLADSLVKVVTADGTVLEKNDDYGLGTNSQLFFIAPQTSSFFIEVKGFDRNQLGDYTLTVIDGVLPDSILPALDWGSAQADNDVTYYFRPAGERAEGYRGEGFNAYEQARFEAAFALIEAVCGLTFREVEDREQADLRMLLDTNEVGDEFLGFFNPPGEARAGNGVFNGAMWDRAAGGSLDAGGYDFVTIVHELLHGLGLAHPHDNGGGSEVFPGVSSEYDDYGYFDLNQGIFTTMSYNTGFPGDDDSQGHAREKWGYEFGPMALDIALLQQKYGANMATATGDDDYILPTENARGTFWQAIWDAGGLDSIRHDGSAASVIDLRAATLRYEEGGGGFVSSVAGIAGGFTIAAGAVIENATGGFGRDRITGNAAGNLLDGRAGADSLSGGDGNDDLQGGAGRDVITGGAGGDNLTGGRGADRFVFVAGDSDALDGDYLSDFRGRDVIDLRSFGALDFIGQAAFGADGDGEVRYQVETSESVLSVDADGDGTADLVFRLAGVTAMDTGDFRLG